MPTEKNGLAEAIARLEAGRDVLGDAAVDAAISALRNALASSPAMPPPEASGQALRQVSILFIDVVGSTALSTRLDPESTGAVMNDALEQFTRIATREGGTVVSYAGDSMLAVFGADVSREDDAVRAVRAGLALLDVGRLIGARVRREHAVDGFDVRVGVHTGTVLFGGGVDGGNAIRGMAVNVAARMEQAALPGRMRISHDTWLHVRGAFDVEAREMLTVKGVDAPVVTYLVRGAKPRAFAASERGIEGVEVRTVGREDELMQLQHAFERLVAGGTLDAVTVLGEAGCGKSRLLGDFRDWASSSPVRFTTLLGRADPQTPTQPYGLLRDVLLMWSGIAEAESQEIAQQSFVSAIVPRFIGADDEVARAHAHLLGHLIGLGFDESPHVRGIRDDARQIRNRAFHAAAEWLRGLAEGGRSPVVMLLDDLHWSDPSSLEFLDFVTDAARDLPVLLIALARPALLERHAGLRTPDGRRRRIDLGPLDADASRRLVDELLNKVVDDHDELSGLIADSAQGNPFYMEALIGMFVDQGAIRIDGDRWTIRRDLVRAPGVPPTVTGVLQARLDCLDAVHKRALQQASVVGAVFWDQALDAIEARASDALPALARRELVVPRNEGTLEELREFAFHHHLLHQVTYDSVLKRERRVYHARVAQWLAGQADARGSEAAGVTAAHYELAGETSSACTYYALAAEHARSRHANDEALRLVERAWALLDRETDAASVSNLALRWRLLSVRDKLRSLRGEHAEQRVAVDAMAEVADALDDDRMRAYAANRRSSLEMRMADYHAQERAARDSVRFAARAGDVETRLHAQRMIADALGARGEFAAGEALAREGLAEARALGLRAIECRFLNALSYMASLRDDEVASLGYDLQELPLWHELGDPVGEAVVLSNVGASWIWFGEFAKAREFVERALKNYRDTGAKSGSRECASYLSLLLLRQGDAEQAIQVARTVLDDASPPPPDVMAGAYLRIGDAALALGQAAEAAHAYARAEALARPINPVLRVEALAGQVRAAMNAADMETAMQHVESLLVLGSSSALDGGAGRIAMLACYRALARMGDPRADAMLERAHASLQERAATIHDDALRRSFLENVPHHREIVEARARRSAVD